MDLGGGAAPAVRVEMNPLAMNKYGIGTEDGRAAITSANFFLAKGAISVGDRSYQINTNDQASVAADYQNLIVAFRHNDPVRLKDIAEVIDGPSNLQNLGLVNGKPGIIIQVRQSPGANIITTVDSVKKILPELQAALGPQIKITTSSTTAPISAPQSPMLRRPCCSPSFWWFWLCWSSCATDGPP